MKRLKIFPAILLLTLNPFRLEAFADVPLYHVYELSFQGTELGPEASPARDILLETLWTHESGEIKLRIYGFWDGDGLGGKEGSVYKVRFCPIHTGIWKLEKVCSNDDQLDGQHEGTFLNCVESDHPGFWEVDEKSAGGRWYKRSDGSHQYITGNTMYSYLSEYYQGEPNGSDIKTDTRNCAGYYKKLRFAITGDIYPNPAEKPFLDDAGNPTDDGNFSHRPNPSWFNRRVDLAVKTAFESDMIADMIINSVDSENGRSVLRPEKAAYDVTPVLRYISARYGSYPNVWFCLTNEYDIRKPKFTEQQIVAIGEKFREMLPYQNPLSVHPSQRDWDPELNCGKWNDHVIFQNKIKNLWMAADKADLNYYRGGMIPVVNDELAYQGEGDGWLEEDVLEAFLGIFLGGGYGSTGYKSGQKLGQYFAGNFDAAKHSVSDNLLWFREVIDNEIPFWKMEPMTVGYSRKEGYQLDIFRNVDPHCRLLALRGEVYVLGVGVRNGQITARLPSGNWNLKLYDLAKKTVSSLGEGVSGEYSFEVPDSRVVFVVAKRSFPTEK